MARILLGVSGGIAAYKAVELVRLLGKDGHSVRVVMSATAERFVGRATFEGITGAPVLVGEFDADPLKGAYPGDPEPGHSPISHLALAERADAIVVAPASANTISKLATGICDSILTTSFLASRAPRIVAPAMNEAMWEDEATRANVAVLRERGATVIEPEVGTLASRGEWGAGRLPEPAKLVRTVAEALSGAPGPLDGWRVLVTAGGTRESIDPVRFIGNRSSGRMGVELAAAAARRGADVTIVAANVDLPTPDGVERIDVESSAELAEATRSSFVGTDLLLMAAAVSDFTVAEPSTEKIARSADASRELRLEPTEDVLAGLAADRRSGQLIVGFAAEHGGDYLDRARRKLERKGVDAILVNDVSDSAIGFDSELNELTLVTQSEMIELPRGSKVELAERILDRLTRLRPSGTDRF